MRHPRISNRAAQADEPQGFEEGTADLDARRDTPTRASARAPQGVETVRHVPIDMVKLGRRIARAKVVRPAAEYRIHVRNDAAEILVAPRSGRQGSHTSAHSGHRSDGRPSMQVVDALPRPYPDGPAHAFAQVTAEKIETLTPP